MIGEFDTAVTDCQPIVGIIDGGDSLADRRLVLLAGRTRSTIGWQYQARRGQKERETSRPQLWIDWGKRANVSASFLGPIAFNV